MQLKERGSLPVAHMFSVGVVTADDNEHVLEM